MNNTQLIALFAMSVCSISNSAAQNLCLTQIVAAQEIAPDKANGADGKWQISPATTSVPGIAVALIGGASAPVTLGTDGVQFAVTYDVGMYSIKGLTVQNGTNEVVLKLNPILQPSGVYGTVYFEVDAVRCSQGQTEVVLKYGCGGCAWAGVNGTSCPLHGGGGGSTYQFKKGSGG